MVLADAVHGGASARPPQLSDGEWAQAVASVAQQQHCAIIATYPEREGERVFTSALFVDRDGRGLCSYRKAHLGPRDVDAGHAPGNWMTIVPFQGERIGLLLGEDMLYPEAPRCLMLEGASLLIAFDQHVASDMLAALARVRALENGLAVVAAGAGHMIAAHPDGRILLDDAAPALVDLGPHLDARRPVPPRRAELYRAMLDSGPGERS